MFKNQCHTQIKLSKIFYCHYLHSLFTDIIVRETFFSFELRMLKQFMITREAQYQIIRDIYTS